MNEALLHFNTICGHDYGAAWARETDGDRGGDPQVEVLFLASDLVTAGIIRALGGRRIGRKGENRWRIRPRHRWDGSGRVLDDLDAALQEAMPDDWRQALPDMLRICTATDRYNVNAGYAGACIVLPSGHRHEDTLRSHPGVVSPRQGTWIVPAFRCQAAALLRVLHDIVAEERTMLADLLAPFAGLSLSGPLPMSADEEDRTGFRVGNVIVVPSPFIAKATPSLPRLDVPFCPMRVDDFERHGPAECSARLSFLTGAAAWQFVSDHRLATRNVFPPPVCMDFSIHDLWTVGRSSPAAAIVVGATPAPDPDDDLDDDAGQFRVRPDPRPAEDPRGLRPD
jgi:hypothetical protein